MALLLDEVTVAQVFIQGLRLFRFNIIPYLLCIYSSDQNLLK